MGKYTNKLTEFIKDHATALGITLVASIVLICMVVYCHYNDFSFGNICFGVFVGGFVVFILFVLVGVAYLVYGAYPAIRELTLIFHSRWARWAVSALLLILAYYVFAQIFDIRVFVLMDGYPELYHLDEQCEVMTLEYESIYQKQYTQDTKIETIDIPLIWAEKNRDLERCTCASLKKVLAWRLVSIVVYCIIILVPIIVIRIKENRGHKIEVIDIDDL